MLPSIVISVLWQFPSPLVLDVFSAVEILKTSPVVHRLLWLPAYARRLVIVTFMVLVTTPFACNTLRFSVCYWFQSVQFLLGLLYKMQFKRDSICKWLCECDQRSHGPPPPSDQSLQLPFLPTPHRHSLSVFHLAWKLSVARIGFRYIFSESDVVSNGQFE